MSSVDARLLQALGGAAVHMPVGDLARDLGETSEAIYLAMEALVGAGFEIEARPGLGIRLLGSPDRLIADELKGRLGVWRMIREVVVFEETDSTNEVAMRLGRGGSAGGVVIFAEHQTAGRGRFGRRWESTSHRGLWFSLLVRPEVPLGEWSRLTTWAAVMVALAIEETVGIRVEIKWPNDLFIQGKKIAGILAESGGDELGRGFAVVGMGVNVNQVEAEFPEELKWTAGSLRMATGKWVGRSELAGAILRGLDRGWTLLENDFAGVVKAASERSLLMGRWIEVRNGENFLAGMAECLDEEGHLMMRRGDGGLERLVAGEVTVVAR